MTIKELKETLDSVNKGLSYKMYRQAILIGQAFAGKLPKTQQEATPELFPPRKRYKMPDWIRKRYLKQKGVSMSER